MANTKSANSGTHTIDEIKAFYEANKSDIMRFANKDAIKTLRDVTKVSNKVVNTIDKATLKRYFDNIGNNEKNLRKVSRYLYYRSNIYFRLVAWYAGLWNLKCRKVTPPYNILKGGDNNKMLKAFSDTLDVLDTMDLQGAMTEVLTNVYVDDVCYNLVFYDESGMFFFTLDPDECMIDSRYYTKDFGFSIDLSKWKSAPRQKVIEYLGSPLKEMYAEYERTGNKWIHVPDEYAACFKFRSDTWDMVVPPFISIFLRLASLEDLVDIQADADALSIYKLIYMPLKVLSGAKESDDFEITPDIAELYFKRLLDAIPDNVAGAVVPGEELKVIDFDNTADKEITSVESASNELLQTAGGGAVINTNRITSTAAFNAWLKSETEFALSTLLPQINGFCNRFLSYHVSNPCKVDHFEVSIYTQKDLAEQLLNACQYSFSYRLAYGTLLNISEKETLTMLYFENEVLKLQDLMKYPLTSSFTTSGGETEDGYTNETGQGRPTVDDDKLSPSGERSRNK